MPTTFKFVNFFATEMLEGVSAANTELVVPVEAAQALPTLSTDEEIRLVLWDGQQDPEIVAVTSNPQSGILTVVRGKESTTAKIWTEGTQVRCVLTAEIINTALEAYFDLGTALTPYLLKAGGTLTGALTLHADPTLALHAATKQYVDNFVDTEIMLKSGGTMTGAINMNENSIVGLPAPSADSEPATKVYVDDALASAVGSESTLGLAVEALENAFDAYVADVNGTLSTGGTSSAYTVSTSANYESLVHGTRISVRFHTTNAAGPTIAVDGQTAKPIRMVTGGTLPAGALSPNIPYDLIYTTGADSWLLVGQRALTDTELKALGWANAKAALGGTMINGQLDVSVSGNDLIIAVKTLAGEDPTAADPVYFVFRSATAGDGDHVVRPVTAALSITVDNGSTLGTSNSVPFRIWITAHDNAGTVALGVSNRAGASGISSFDVGSPSDTTAEGDGTASSAEVIYTQSALSGKAFQIIGYAEWSSGQTVAGAWSAGPSLVQLAYLGIQLPGTIVQVKSTLKTDTTSLTSSVTTFTDITGLAVSLTPRSACNKVLVSLAMTVGGTISVDDTAIHARLMRDSTPIGVGATAGSRSSVSGARLVADANTLESLAVHVLDSPGSASAISYKAQWRCPITADDIFLNRSGTDTDAATHARGASSITAMEIAA